MRGLMMLPAKRHQVSEFLGPQAPVRPMVEIDVGIGAHDALLIEVALAVAGLHRLPMG
jgi:hypothetical protein